MMIVVVEVLIRYILLRGHRPQEKRSTFFSCDDFITCYHNHNSITVISASFLMAVKLKQDL